MPVQSQEPAHFREHKIFESVFTSVFKLFLEFSSIFSQDFLKKLFFFESYFWFWY